MPEAVLHYDGKTRLRFDDPGEKYVYIDIINGSSGLTGMYTRDRMSRTLLVEYEPHSATQQLIEKIIAENRKEPLSKNDVFSYISPLLKNPVTKAVWLMLIYGMKPGFLQFCISSMMINKYIRARFK